MTNLSLAQSYLKKAEVRLDLLDILMEKGAYSDVIRESQEIVELAMKGMLRAVGIEPPKLHDVGGLLLEYKDKFIKPVADSADRLANISKRLRKERELAFYGDIDFIPTEEYTREDADTARNGAHFVFDMARQVIKMPA